MEKAERPGREKGKIKSIEWGEVKTKKVKK